MLNIYDIAKLSNVSIATVSRVINGSPSVRPNTRDKVLAVMKEQGYSPNIFAQGLGSGRKRLIGLLCPEISYMYMAKAVSTLEFYLRKNDYQPLLVGSTFQQEEKEKTLDLLLKKKVDAVILLGSDYADSGKASYKTNYIEETAKEVPVFLINGILPYENVFSTDCGDLDICYHVTCEMIQSGRRHILFLSNSDCYSSKEKREGYVRALKKHNIAVDGNLMLFIENDFQCENTLLMRQDLHFDAVFAATDLLAVGALKYAKKVGKSIPEDLVVVGYNDSFVAKCCEPELSSVNSKVEELCFQTVEKLVRHLNGEKIPKTTVIEAEFVRRCTSDF